MGSSFNLKYMLFKRSAVYYYILFTIYSFQHVTRKCSYFVCKIFIISYTMYSRVPFMMTLKGPVKIGHNNQ